MTGTKREDHYPTPLADLGKLRAQEERATLKVGLGPSWQLAGSFPYPLALKGKSSIGSSSLARLIWAAQKDSLCDPSPSPSLGQHSPPPRVILGRVIQLPPGTANQGAGEGDRDLAAGTWQGPGDYPSPSGVVRGFRDPLQEAPQPSPVWGWKSGPGDNPSSARTHCMS